MNLFDGHQDGAPIRLDLGRARRTGIPEAIYAAGKTPEQVVAIFEAWGERGLPGLATRVSDEHVEAVSERVEQIEYDSTARTLVLPARDDELRMPALKGDLLCVCAGTSDLPVASEAVVTARFLGAAPELLSDVGVAGIDRLLAHRDRVNTADVILCVAGMEGALPSVVSGLTRAPVIAVPTSVGYGAHMAGLTPLLAMLSSCAPGLSVVNVDNGFGAAVCAVKTLQLAERARRGGDSKVV